MNQQLDQRYRELFRELAVGPEEEAALRERVVTELRRRAQCINRVGATRQGPRFVTLPRLACAAAAMIAIVALHQLWVGRNIPQPQIKPAMSISDARLEIGAKLFGELESLFGKRVAWVYETNGKVEMGIQPEITDAAPDIPVMFVRMIVQRRQDSKEWSDFLQTDVIMRGEHFVEITPSAYPGTRLHLWMALTPDGRIAVDTAFFMENGDRLASHLNDVIPEGQAREMAGTKSENDSFRVFQIIERLDEQIQYDA